MMRRIFIMLLLLSFSYLLMADDVDETSTLNIENLTVSGKSMSETVLYFISNNNSALNLTSQNANFSELIDVRNFAYLLELILNQGTVDIKEYNSEDASYLEYYTETKTKVDENKKVFDGIVVDSAVIVGFTAVGAAVGAAAVGAVGTTAGPVGTVAGSAGGGIAGSIIGALSGMAVETAIGVIFDLASKIIIYFDNLSRIVFTSVDAYNHLAEVVRNDYSRLEDLGFKEYQGKYSNRIDSLIAHTNNITGLNIVKDIKAYNEVEYRLFAGDNSLIYLPLYISASNRVVNHFWNYNDSFRGNFYDLIFLHHKLQEAYDLITNEDYNLTSTYTTKYDSLSARLKELNADVKQLPPDLYYIYELDYERNPMNDLVDANILLKNSKSVIDDSSTARHVNSLYDAISYLDRAEARINKSADDLSYIEEQLKKATYDELDSLEAQYYEIYSKNPDYKEINYFGNQIEDVKNSLLMGSNRANSIVIYYESYHKIKTLEQLLPSLVTKTELDVNITKRNDCINYFSDVISKVRADGFDTNDWELSLINLKEDPTLNCEELRYSFVNVVNSYYNVYSPRVKEVVDMISYNPKLASSTEYKRLINYLDVNGDLIPDRVMGHLGEIKGYVESLKAKINMSERGEFLDSLKLEVSDLKSDSKVELDRHLTSKVRIFVYSGLKSPHFDKKQTVVLKLPKDFSGYVLESSSCPDVMPMINKNILSLSFDSFRDEGCYFDYEKSIMPVKLISKNIVYISPNQFAEIYKIKVLEDNLGELQLLPTYNYSLKTELNGQRVSNSFIYDNLMKGPYTIKYIYSVPKGISYKVRIDNNSANVYKIYFDVENNLPILNSYNITQILPTTDNPKPNIKTTGCIIKSYNLDKSGSTSTVRLSLVNIEHKCEVMISANFQLTYEFVDKRIRDLEYNSDIDKVKLHLDRAKSYINLDLRKAYNEVLKAEEEVNKYSNLLLKIKQLDGEYIKYEKNTEKYDLEDPELLDYYSKFRLKLQDYENCANEDIKCKTTAIGNIRKYFNRLYLKAKSSYNKVSKDLLEVKSLIIGANKRGMCKDIILPTKYDYSKITPFEYIQHIDDYITNVNKLRYKANKCRSILKSRDDEIKSTYKMSLDDLKENYRRYRKACEPDGCNEDIVEDIKKLLNSNPVSDEEYNEFSKRVVNYNNVLVKATTDLKDRANNEIRSLYNFADVVNAKDKTMYDKLMNQIHPLEKDYSSGKYYVIIKTSAKLRSAFSSKTEDDNKIFIAALGIIVVGIIVLKIYQDYNGKEKGKKSVSKLKGL